MKKLKLKTTIAAVLIPAIITLLALAPFPQGIKIIGDLVFQERAAVATTPVAGTGTFYVKNTVPSKPMFVDDTGAEIELGEAGAGGSDPTYGSNAGAADDAVYVDADNEVGIGTTTPSENLHIYSTAESPRVLSQYYNAGSTGNTEGFAGAGSNSGTGFAWGTPTAIYSNNGVYAQCDPSSDSQSQYLVSGTHAIVVPDGAEIVGIEFDVAAFYIPISSPTDGYDVDVYAVKGGTILTGYDMASATQWPNTETVRTYGGPTNLLGTTWTEAEVEASGFGLAFKVSVDADDVLFVDYIKARVYYSTGVAGDYKWSLGTDITATGAFTITSNLTDFFSMDYSTGAATFTGVVDADGYKQDGVLYDLSTFGAGGGDVNGPASATDNAIARYDTTTGKLLQNSEVTIGDTGSITLGSLDTIDGRDPSVDGAKLDGIETGATADQSNAEIETAYNTQVSAMDQSTAEAGTSTTIQRVTAERLRQAANAVDFTFSGDLSGTVTNIGSGVAATIAADAVTNAKLNNMPAYTFKGNNTGGSANPVDMDVPDSMTMLGAAYADGELVDLGTASTGTSTTVTCAYAPGKYYVYTVILADNASVVTSGSTLVAGNKFILIVTQDGSGGNTLDFDNTYFRFSTELVEPTIPTTASSQSVYMFMYLGGGKYSLLAYNQGF